MQERLAGQAARLMKSKTKFQLVNLKGADHYT